jgi:hypothetical protein
MPMRRHLTVEEASRAIVGSQLLWMQETEGNHHPFISHTKTLSHITFSAIEKNLILFMLLYYSALLNI